VPPLGKYGGWFSSPPPPAPPPPPPGAGAGAGAGVVTPEPEMPMAVDVPAMPPVSESIKKVVPDNPTAAGVNPIV